MCYSAQIRADFHKYVRRFGADINIREFYRLYWLRDRGEKIRIPRALDLAFADPGNDEEARIKALIDAHDRREAARLEQELFRQRKRLADAERALAVKHTRGAAEDRRIAGDKVEWALGKLAALRRSEPIDEDSRIFPGWHAPVIATLDGRRVATPMRYQCRLAGRPASFDRRFSGTYNARRDSLEGFWRTQFGVTHALMIVNAFYENVARHAMERRALAPGEKEENVVLEFRPRPP